MADPARVVLSGLFTNDVTLVDEVSRVLTEVHFTDPNLRSLFRGALAFRSVAGGVLTSTAVSDLVSGADAGTAVLVGELFDSLVASSATLSDTRWAVSRLRAEREHWLTQVALNDSAEILSGSIKEEKGDRVWSGPADAREWAVSRIAEIASEVSIDSSPAGDVRDEARDVMAAYASAKSEDRSRRPRFGLQTLDQISGGLGPGELVVVGAPSGLGKSHFVTNLAYEAVVRQGLSVYFATSETVRAVVRNRIVAHHSRHERWIDVREHLGVAFGLDSSLIGQGALPGPQEEFLAMVVADLAQAPGALWLAQVPHGQTMSVLAAQVDARSRARQVDLVVVDYLALMSGGRRFESRRAELAATIIDAKHFAVDHNRGAGVPLVSPWQFNRQAKEEMLRTGTLDLDGLAETSEIVNSQPLHAKVLTPTGYVDMGSLSVGDSVIDPEGDPSKVLAVYPLGRKKTYRITFADGGVAESSLDHVWKVRGPRNGRVSGEGWRLLRLGDFASGVDRLPPSPLYPNRPRNTDEMRRVIPTMIAPDFEDVGERLLEPYLVGLLLGDGSLSSDKSCVTFSSCDEELLAGLESSLPYGTKLSRRSLRFEGHEKWSELITVSIVSCSSRRPGCNLLNFALRHYGLWGRGSVDKFVPVEYKFAPASVRLAVLQGLMDTDGTTGSKSGQGKANVFTSVSERLRDDVVWLARSLGCKVSGLKRKTGIYYTVNGQKMPAKDSYYCLIVPPSSVSIFRLSRKVDSQRKYLTNRPVRPVVKVEFVGEHEHQCIKVSCESQLYVTDDFTVTHNTPDTVLALAPDGEREGRFANLKLGVLKNRDGAVLTNGNEVGVRVDYATSFFAERMGVEAGGSSSNGHGGVDDALSALLG